MVVSLDGLAEEWDAVPSVREALRAGQSLIMEVSEKQVDLKTPSRYAALLTPVLQRMVQGGKRMPAIEDLRTQVRAVLTLNKVSENDTEKFAWLIRKQLGFIKMKCRRREVSTDS